MDLKAGLAAQSVSFAAWTTATGAPVTVTSATAGLSLWYRRGVAGAKVAISVADLATLETAWASGKILVIEGANHRLDLPDLAIAAGVLSVEWGGTATGITIDGGVANLIGQANSATDTTAILGTALTETGAGRLAAAAVKFGDVATPVTTAASVNQTGDSYGLLGTLFSGITSLAQWLGLIAGKQVGDNTARTELRATGAGSGTFDETTDSAEAIRDRGDAAWLQGNTVAPDPAGTGAAIVSTLASAHGAGSWLTGGTSTLNEAGVRSAIGMAAANLDTQLAAITGGAGGTFAQTVTVTCSAVAVQGATVEILSGSTLIDRQTTNASGVAVPTCDTGNYTLRVSHAGLYASNTSTIVVTAAAARAVSLTAIAITPSATPGQVTGWLTLYSQLGVIEPGATLSVRQYSATGQEGFDSATQTWTANGVGVASGPLWLEEYYQVRRGTGEWSEAFLAVDDGAGVHAGAGTMLLVGVLGSP